MKRDPAHEATDRILAALEKEMRREYRKAVRDTDAKLKDYLRRFEIKDQKWQQMVASGKKTEQEYKQWRLGQIAVGKRWETLRDKLAQEYHEANVIARSMVDGTRAQIYAENFNFATYELEMGAKVSTGFTLYNADAVNRIIRENPELLPPPGKRMAASIAAGKDVAWQAGQIQSVMTQAILQGESIPHIAQRIAETMGDKNHASTIRYARTAVTAAENAGREDAYRRAEEMGIDSVRMWQAVLDNRTRHEHRQLDGQQRPVGEPFEVDGEEIMFPGDPSAPGYLIWNCRCRTRAVVKGLEPMARKYRKIEGDLTYEEWKAAKPTRSDRITKQEEIAEAMKWRTISELYKD